MDNTKDCMLKEITSFLIKVGEHCLECEKKLVEPSKIVPIATTTKKQHKHNPKISYLEKWVKQNNFEVFSLEQFYKMYPRQRRSKRLNGHISKLISNGLLIQLGKNRFKVNRRKKENVR